MTRVLAAILLLGATLPCRAEGDTPEPYQLVRVLQSLQNDAAAGKSEARAAQGKLAGDIAAAFRAVEPQRWRSRRNAEAAILFILSGGPAATVRAPLLAAASSLAKGALAYAEGREAEARALLLPLDPLSQPAALGGPLALAQAALVMHDEPKRALTLLDQARLLSPGTIVEEAALRRAFFIADEMGDGARLLSSAALYRRRFPNSVYAEGVEARLGPAALRLAENGAPETEAALALLAPAARLDLRLRLARAALVRADLAEAARQSGYVLAEATEGSAQATRAAFYRAAAQFSAEDGLARLEAVDRTQLADEDVALLDVARVAARSSRTPGLVGPGVVGPGVVGNEFDSPLLRDAASALAAADALLAGAP